jgi:hypothetical protein
MKVGYCVEGSTDKWVLHGLRHRWRRWCPHVELVEGRYRGSFKRREIPKACLELRTKGVDLIVLLRDANDENWREVAQGDRAACRSDDAHLVIVGVCDRNVECWLVADLQYAARRLGVTQPDLDVEDPKSVFDRAMGITPLDDRHAELIDFVRSAPLHRWLSNRSFEHFYDQFWQKSKERGCSLENLREGHST